MKKSFRLHCREFLHNPITRWSQVFNGILSFFIFLSFALVPLYIISPYTNIIATLWQIERFIAILFGFEYLLRIWSAQSAVRYIFSWKGIIDLLSILPCLFILLGIIPRSLLVIEFLAFIRIIKMFNIYEKERQAMRVEVLRSHRHSDFKTLKGEEIRSITFKHPIVFIQSFISIFILITLSAFIFSQFGTQTFFISLEIFFLIIALLIFFRSWIKFHYDVIYITDHRIIMQHKYIFGLDRNVIPYQAITNIHPNTSGLLKIIFGYGDLTIETATTSKEKMTFRYCPHPAHIMRDISKVQRKEIRRQKEISKPHAQASNSPTSDIKKKNISIAPIQKRIFQNISKSIKGKMKKIFHSVSP